MKTDLKKIYNNFVSNNFIKYDPKQIEIIEEIKGNYGKKPELVSENFDTENKETFMLWGHFLLKFKK